jgi:hypothetical protein
VIEGWQISVIIGLLTLAGTFAVNRFVTGQNAKRIDGVSKKVDEHSEVISEHKIIVSNAVTMEQVDSKFLTRDLFAAHEKHIDHRFHSLEKKLDNGFEEVKSLLKKH